MTILVTGAAGFIGYHACQTLLSRGEKVIGVDNLNDYYDVRLKQARLEQLQANKHFEFYLINIADRAAVENLVKEHSDISRIIHLAAQAGVRYSLINPYAYSEANVLGHLTILEACRRLPKLKHLVYASSSSVYGANQKLPFSVSDPVEQPISLYAATKRSCELMSYTYSHLFQIPATGLRFFTVYGPWGRPDMSAFIFTKAILTGQVIPVFNHGDMRRNFTYVDDIVQGTLACLDNPGSCSIPQATSQEALSSSRPPHRVYNIGNNKSEPLMNFIHTLENIIGKKANIQFEDMQPGDVKETIADISDTTRDFGFLPKTNIEEGLQNFVSWYRGFYNV
jgi:UDP-glucuronate 4-epimerase